MSITLDCLLSSDDQFFHSSVCECFLCSFKNFFAPCSHAIAGGFSPAIATFLYTNFGLNAAGLVYVVFGSLSVLGIYINFFCGRNDKEEDTGSPVADSEVSAGDLEMKESADNIDDSEGGLTKETPGSFKNIV